MIAQFITVMLAAETALWAVGIETTLDGQGLLVLWSIALIFWGVKVSGFGPSAGTRESATRAHGVSP